MVIAGHTRLKAAHKLGINKVPVRWMDLDPAEARLLALADNRLNERAAWDDDTLAAVLEALNAEGVDLEGLGWEQSELDALLSGASVEDVAWKEFDETIGDGEPGAAVVDCPHCGESFTP